MYCPNCNAEIRNDALICDTCGYSMSQKAKSKRSAEEYKYEYATYDAEKPLKHSSKKPLAVVLLIVAVLFTACSAFALLTGFGVIDNYFGLFEITTESTTETTAVTTETTIEITTENLGQTVSNDT